MKNLLSSWFRSLTAFDSTPAKQEFSIADPTNADPKGLSTVTLSVTPSDGQSPTMVSLYFEASGVKLFEKKYQDDQAAQAELGAMAKDLNEAAALSKEGKTDEAKNLVSSLIEKYKRTSDTLLQPSPVTTNTQASQEPLQYKGFKLKKLKDGTWQAAQDELAFTADSIDSVKAKVDNMLRKAHGKKLAKRAEIVMQNLFFSTPDEALEYQEKMKKLQGPESGEGKPLWEQMGNEEIATSNETSPEEDTELAPPSLSFDRIEKDKAKTDKDIGKRIKEQVKTEVESALEQKSASVFGKDQEELVEALRKNGRNWDEIKKIFVKELSYNEDDTTVFLDSIRSKEEGGPEGLPAAPKPPEDLVSPETHDKLIKEIEDKTEIKPEPKPLEDEIARADNAEIRKVATEKTALNPLQEPPAIGQTPGQPLAAPVEENPTFDAPVPPLQDSNPEPEFLEAPQTGDRVYVMGDYETGQDGFEGTMVSEYSSKGDDYAVISKDDGENAEVALHRVVKASQKKVAKAYYEKKVSKKAPEIKPRMLDDGETLEEAKTIAKDEAEREKIEKKKADFKINPELQSIHTSALKIQAELEHDGEIAIYFHKEGLDKQASSNSAFEGSGWCRVWVDDFEIEINSKYPEIVKLPDENARIAALKDLAREIAHEALAEADDASRKFGVQTWVESLEPSRHDRIDWVALANPEQPIESAQESKIEKKADPQPEAPKEVPTQFKQLQKAPSGTEREKAQPASEEQANLVKEMEKDLSSLEALKSMIAQAKAKLNEEINNIEQQGGRVQIEAGLKEKMERLAKLVEATQNQMINAGDTVVRLVQESKERPFKPSDAWKVEKLVEKFAGAQEYLDKAIAGAQSLATTEQVRDLVFFPRKVSKLHKSAGFVETLDSIYNDVLEALKILVGTESEKAPTAV